MITASGASGAQTRKRSVRWAGQERLIRKRGFTLIEALVSLFLLGVVGVLIGAAFSFSVKSQQDTGLQLKAARNAARVLEILRTADFDSLDPIESGWPSFSSFSTREKLILTEIQDTLMANGLVLALTVRSYEEREDTKYIAVSVRSNNLGNDDTAVTQGEISVGVATLVTRRGLNP